MRATWPTARKSESEPGASAGARLRNRSGDNRMNRLSLFFLWARRPGCPMSCPCRCPGSCRARARHIPAGRAVRSPCGVWERPSSAGRGCGAVRPPVGMCGRRSVSPRVLPLLPPFFSRILSLPGSFRHRPPCGVWERPSSSGRGCGVVRPPVGMCGRRSVSPRFLPPSSSSLRFLPPALPSFSRCRSGPRDSSGKRCGGEK